MNKKHTLLSVLLIVSTLTSADAKYICKSDDLQISKYGKNEVHITKYLCIDDTIKNPEPDLYEVEYETVLFNNGEKYYTLPTAARYYIENTPYKFPYLVIRLSYYGSAMTSNYKIYETQPQFKEIATINNVLTTSSANKGKGSPYFMAGFYTDKKGNFLIDRMTTKGTPMAKCNSCQTYNIETLKLKNGKFIPVSLRNYDFETYKRYKMP